MKQFFLFFIFSISVSNLFAQQKKGDNYIGINGMYNTTISQDGVEGNSIAVKSHLLNMGMALSGSMNNHFLIGIGLDYVSQNDDRNSSFIFHNQNNDYIKYETMNLKSHVFLPNLFVGYYSHIVDRLYFNSNLKLSYGQVKTNTDGQQVSFKYTPPATTIGIPSGTVDVPVVYTNKAEDKTDFASTAIIPELNYYFSNNFGLTLGLGGIQYSLTKWKTENSSFTVNFNPSNWQIGAKIRIK
jgi:hypothetical protein